MIDLHVEFRFMYFLNDFTPFVSMSHRITMREGSYVEFTNRIPDRTSWGVPGPAEVPIEFVKSAATFPEGSVHGPP